MCKISVIVPVYNAGDYFEECIDTLLNQTLKDIEIILILDKPTDGTDIKAKKYAEKDNRIKLIFNESNLHIGMSRNFGFKIAKGEYIGFSDHDDFRKLDMYENLYNQAKKADSDIVISKTTNYIEGTFQEWDLPNKNSNDIRSFVLSDLIGKGNYGSELSIFCNLHNVIYRREMLINHSIEFVDTKKISPEDVLFNIEACIVACKIDFCYEGFYFHRIDENSEGHNYSYGSLIKRLEGMKYLEMILIKNDMLNIYQPQFYIQVSRQIMQGLLGTLLYKKSFKEFFNSIELVRKYDFIRESFKYNSTVSKDRGFLKNKLRKILSNYIKS